MCVQYIERKREGIRKVHSYGKEQREGGLTQVKREEKKVGAIDS